MTARKSFVLSVLAVLALAVPFAAPAQAQPTQNGLVNVNLQDIDIAVPIAVAANVCDVNINVIATQFEAGDTVCTATAESGATFGPSQGGGSARQRGLVNVNVSDVTVLVPVSVAANICDVDANVLAQQREFGQATCDAVAQSTT
jgi:hypothetical protein